MRGNEIGEHCQQSSEGYTVGKKVIVCGRSVWWRDDEIKEKIEQRCAPYFVDLLQPLEDAIRQQLITGRPPYSFRERLTCAPCSAWWHRSL